MKHTFLKCSAPLLSAALLASLAAGCGASGGQSPDPDASAAPAAAQTEVLPAAPAEASASPEAETGSGENTIVFSGGGIRASGAGLSVSGSTVTVSAGDTYTVSGALDDGRILVDAQGEDVILVFDGVDLACSDGSPVYIYRSASTTIRLAEGSVNSLADGAEYSFSDSRSSASDDEPNACLYSKSDLIIEGAGSLTVTGNYNNGVTSKDTLTIVDADVTVNAVNNGVTGKDSAELTGAGLTVVCGGDALRSTNDGDSALGWVKLRSSSLELTAGEDGVQAETSIDVEGGTYTVSAGGGSGSAASDGGKGFKAGTALTVSDGMLTLDCSDDAFHSDGSLTVSGGAFSVLSGDDAFHADGALTVSAGEISIIRSHEGLEAKSVELSGGTVYIVADDDGVNAAGGADGSGFAMGGGRGGRDSFSGGGSQSLNISGGTLCIYSSGDGLDSNGSISMSGGTVIVYSSGGADGALDHDGSFSITGGSLIAAGGGMPEAPSSADQNAVYIGFGSTLKAGTVVALSHGSEQIVVQLPVNSSYLVVSSPDMSDGEWAVTYGGDYTGEFSVGVGSGGVCSGGTEAASLTLSGGLVVSGGAGWGAMGGMSGPGAGFGGGFGDLGGFGGRR